MYPQSQWPEKERLLTRLLGQAIAHGNKPSRGAEIDKELQEEDEAILRKKGDAMPGKKN